MSWSRKFDEPIPIELMSPDFLEYTETTIVLSPWA